MPLLSGDDVAREELKALLALGVLASLAVLLQLGAQGVRFFVSAPPSSSIAFWEALFQDTTLASFGLYIGFLALALGFDTFQSFEVAARELKWIGDAFFLGGGIILFCLGFVYIFRIFLG